MKIGKKIAQIREDRGYTQEDLAEELRVTRQTVSNWETNKCYPDIETLIILSDKFDISLDALLRENIDMVRDIDKKVKALRYSKKFKVVMGIIILLVITSIWFAYKRVLVYYYRVENREILAQTVKGIKGMYVTPNTSLSNTHFMGLNLYVPEDLTREVDDEEYGEMKFYDGNVLNLWFTKSIFSTKTGDKCDYFGFDYDELLRKYDIGSEMGIIKYYLEHRYEVPSVFWSKSRIQMYYLASDFISRMDFGNERIYEVGGSNVQGYMYNNGRYYVFHLITPDNSYYLKFNSEVYSLRDIEHMLSAVYVDGLNFGNLS